MKVAALIARIFTSGQEKLKIQSARKQSLQLVRPLRLPALHVAVEHNARLVPRHVLACELLALQELCVHGGVANRFGT